MSRLLRLFLLFAVLFLIASPAYADIGAPMIFITLPMLIIGLIPIILVEAYMLKKKLKIELKLSIKTSSIMNVVSIIVGIPITWVILVLIQMLTGGGGAHGLQTPLQKFLAVTWQSPWLIPYESELYWMVPAASLVLLFPFFFASWFVELLTAKRILKQIDKISVNKSIFLANLSSYSILLVLAALWLIISIVKGK